MHAPTPTPTQVRDAWDAIADGFDRHTTPHTLALGEQVVARFDLGPGARVLDVAAGTGALSIPAARTGADVVAVDIAPTMVQRLAQRASAEDLRTLTARVGDGAALDLADDSFDLTMSMNGISLFGDLAQGLGEALRVTRSGGEVAIITFAPLPQVEFISFFLGALQVAAPGAVPLPDGPLPPFRLSDPDVLATTLEDRGLRDVSVETVVWETTFTSVDDLLDVVLSSNPIAGQLVGGLDADQRDRVRQVLDGMLRERSGGQSGGSLHARLHVGRGTV